MTLTLTDMFCGAGGSSTGAIQVPGVTVRVASNHWQLAIETHNTNHPDADHICADLTQIDPRYFPTTDIGWFSPECTNHSIAKGKKRADSTPDLFDEVLPDDAAERSRATMWDVVRFTEFHRYRAIIVENVVDAWNWTPFKAWLMAMDSLGYHHEVVYLNSMHAQLRGPGAPQSRDRMYIVFWQHGNTKPALHRVTRPHAVCAECGPVRAMQSWKRTDRAPWGRYRAQYVYRCPNVKCRNRIVEPAYRPASDIIDWSLQGTRIGDRPRPLAAKTMARIQAGIDRYWSDPFMIDRRGEYRVRGMDAPLSTVTATETTKALVVPVEGREGKSAASTDDPMRTMTTRSETGVALPFVTVMRGQSKNHRSDAALSTVSGGGIHHGVVSPPFIAELRGGGSVARPASDPLATVTASGNHHGLVTAFYGKGSNTSPTSKSLPTVTTTERHGLLEAERPTIDIDDVRFRMLEPREIVAAMDFPSEYIVLGTRREQVRMAGNAVTPPAARDLVAVVAESLLGAA
ncbi:DNA methyltransferase [Rhodococcus sp. 15-649-2-2]|uniref:DNA cytosine methyltransferase n=1 Tax=Rhodococcus sp. 15-649-2-2 TaxID=2023140 RepID=UPI000B9B477E|nr:DNA cytosine methyltransferase [Rhodococcus sp. 15-649-2-2]OZE77175.1 DNA methyltransferase [Rhodococcus sp. 15-649-2-2]